MTCPEHDELSAYMDDMLPPGEGERLASHLPNCPICRQRLGELNALRLSLRELPSPVLGFDLAARLEGRLNAAHSRKQPARPSWFVWAPGGLLAMMGLAAGVWLGSLLIGGAAGMPSSTLTLRVFDPVPPGGLCAVPELCRVTKGSQ